LHHKALLYDVQCRVWKLINLLDDLETQALRGYLEKQRQHCFTLDDLSVMSVMVIRLLRQKISRCLAFWSTSQYNKHRWM